MLMKYPRPVGWLWDVIPARHQAQYTVAEEVLMDKPRRPNVIRTWKQYHPVRGVSPIKSAIDRRSPVRGVPQMQKPQRRSGVEKPPESVA